MREIKDIELLWISIDSGPPLDPHCAIEPRKGDEDATSSSEARGNGGDSGLRAATR